MKAVVAVYDRVCLRVGRRGSAPLSVAIAWCFGAVRAAWTLPLYTVVALLTFEARTDLSG